jgi:hypothetical protein
VRIDCKSCLSGTYVCFIIQNETYFCALCQHLLTLNFAVGKTLYAANSCVAPWHHCVACRLVAGRGDGFQIRTVAARVLDNLLPG